MDYDARGAGVVRGASAGLRPGGCEGLGLEAVDTARYRFSHFSWSYGCELEALVGQPYTADAKLSEAERYVTEALLVSPYIREARVRDKRFEGSTLHAGGAEHSLRKGDHLCLRTGPRKT